MKRPPRGRPSRPLGHGDHVSRETIEAVCRRFGLSAGSAEQIRLLLEALAAEPDPPTTVRAPAAALDGHVADSLSGLAVSELSAARRVADVGAGAGFPGLALAVALPGASIDLVESAGRKAAVIERLARAAELTNARAVTARVEEWGAVPGTAGGGGGAYDAVTVRAVAALPVLAEYAAPLLRDGGVLIAWKGARDAAEEGAGRAAAEQLGLVAEDVLHVEPFEGARDRHLHVYRKVAPTPERFPRRPGIAVKR
ncbi:MAG TPA: 16S rRNA (guanine(527)-N(7))-methyltransferase RsmG, partial [Thermoleophilaceae bacterium]|nr:16S rRNA (guanine(527)-N(7))-methyltransferase RsmG [Thermoleophilaceae bacterium]